MCVGGGRGGGGVLFQAACVISMQMTACVVVLNLHVD